MTDTQIQEQVTQEDREAATRHADDDQDALAVAFARHRTAALSRLEEENAALREALAAEDDYWAASRALASALPRLREPAEAVFAAATQRRDAARATLSGDA